MHLSKDLKEKLTDLFDDVALFAIAAFAGMWFVIITLYQVPALLQTIVIVIMLALMYRAFSTGNGDMWDGAVMVGILFFGVLFIASIAFGAPEPDFWPFPVR